MASQHPREHEAPGPLREGEFQRIAGIGPGIAQRLHAAGIETFSHLASLAPEEICARLNGLVGMTAERIANQDWPGKAQQLAQQLQQAAEEPPTEPEGPGARQHYASFMIELLQDETYAVRRTRVVHVQSGAKENWAGWDKQRLDEWIAGQAAIPKTEPAAEVVTAAEEQPAASKKETPYQLPAMELGESKIFIPGRESPGRFLKAGQPFELHLPVQLAGEVPEQILLAYQAAAHARTLGGPRIQIAESSGPYTPGDQPLLTIPVDGLGEGTYHLEMMVRIYPVSATALEKEGRFGLIEGGLVHVFAHEAEPVT